LRSGVKRPRMSTAFQGGVPACLGPSQPSPRLDLAGYKRPMLPFKPCLPTAPPVPPSAPEWLHEIKHDGYRIVALRNGERVRLISRRGIDWAWRIPMVTAAIKALPVSLLRHRSISNCFARGGMMTRRFSRAGPDCIRARVQARPRGYCLEAPEPALCGRPLAQLAQGEESRCAGGGGGSANIGADDNRGSQERVDFVDELPAVADR
jgi:hypothetical protein